MEFNEHTIVVKGRGLRIASVHDEEWLETELQDPELCIKTLKAQGRGGLRADIFTFMQKLPATQPRYDYPLEYESIAAADTSNFEEWWTGLPQESRKNVRRSEKRGVAITLVEFNEELILGLMELNNDSPVRQGRPNLHYGKTADQVRRDHSAFLDRSCLIGAHVDKELVGFLKLVYRGDVASILQCMPKASHSDKRPANAMIAKAVGMCAAKGIKSLAYGKFNYGNKGDSSLREFKVRNGFREVLVPRFYVPLTSWGAVCMKLKLHKGLHGVLPHSIIKAGVDARAKWHNVRQANKPV
jgi:hypothetical protein